MAITGLEVYLAFSGVQMTIPYGTVENYQKAVALADELTGYTARAPGATFSYLETKDQLDALFALQRELGLSASDNAAAFYDYCIWLHQDSEYDYGPTLENMIAGAFSRIRPDQHQPLRAFIEELLTGAYSEADLIRILRSTDADSCPSDPVRRSIS